MALVYAPHKFVIVYVASHNFKIIATIPLILQRITRDCHDDCVVSLNTSTVLII